MNIFALSGHKVKVTADAFTNANDYDRQEMKKLEIGKIYTIDRTEVGNYHTDVWLKEFPDEKFNSTNFEDAIKQSKKMDKEHEDWSRYNG